MMRFVFSVSNSVERHWNLSHSNVKISCWVLIELQLRYICIFEFGLGVSQEFNIPYIISTISSLGVIFNE